MWFGFLLLLFSRVIHSEKQGAPVGHVNGLSRAYKKLDEMPGP